jgi:hypothetical protein
MEFIKKYTSYLPDMPSTSEVIKHMDSYLLDKSKAVTEFLDEHPGIAILLSPTSITRRAAQKHVDNMLHQK